MDKQSKYKKLSKIENQLELLDIKKRRILKDLYKSYEIYLTEVRTQIFNSVRKGIFSLACLTQRKGRMYEDNITFLIDNEIKPLTDQLLPFLTIEQLSIFDENNKNNINNINHLNDFINNQFSEVKGFTSQYFQEELNYKSDCYYYYEVNSYNKIESSVDLDNQCDENHNKFETKLIEDFEDKKMHISSKNLTRNEINSKNSCQQFNTYNIFEENELSTILEWSDLIDIGLSSQLKRISIEINNKLFSNIFTKEIMPEKLVSYLFENNFLTTNPRPFIAKLDLLSNEYICGDEFLKNIGFSKIYLFCINSTELEFNNITLNIARNKIRKLKNLLRSLIKKEQYWTSRKLYSNYDLYKVYKN